MNRPGAPSGEQERPLRRVMRRTTRPRQSFGRVQLTEGSTRALQRKVLGWRWGTRKCEAEVADGLGGWSPLAMARGVPGFLVAPRMPIRHDLARPEPPTSVLNEQVPPA